MICFFSSNLRPQYKSDIYTVSCLPWGYVVHFRYQKKYVHPEVYRNISQLTNREGIIFFAKTNEPHNCDISFSSENISVRLVSILEIIEDHATNLIHCYLQLRDFSEAFIQNDSEKVPPKYFLADLNINRGTKHTWLDRINHLKDSFNNYIFIHFKILKKGSLDLVLPIYEAKEKDSIYFLKDESEYSIDIDFAHSAKADKMRTDKFPVIIIEDKLRQLDICINEFIDIGTNIDKRKIRLLTSSITGTIKDSFLIFKIGIYDQTQNKIESIVDNFSIVVRLKKSYVNIVLFSFYSVVGLGAIAAMAIFNSKLDKGETSYFFLILSLIFGAFSSGMLYKKFNKK